MESERPLRLTAGAWELEFERTTGWVRCIRLGGVEVVRAVYANVRDENWRTLAQRITHCHVSQGEGAFEADWTAELDSLAFAWNGHLSGSDDRITVEWTGTAKQEFETRRTGMCVLHPMELKGQPCTVIHGDGKSEGCSFPTSIEPHQPFFDVRQIRHKAGDAEVLVSFEGEVFEMEDQRNWTDVSFKTYCRPQAWPQPYQLQEGDLVRHSVTLVYQGVATAPQVQCYTTLTKSDQEVQLPLIGTLAHQKPDEFDFVLDSDDVADWTATGFGRVYAVSGQFVELNRNRPDMGEWDGVAYQASPQVHAFDDRSVMENTYGLAETVKTAKLIAQGKPVCVGPVRLRRTNLGRDPRLDMPLGPAWLVATIVSAARGGADAICISEADDFRGPLAEAMQVFAGRGRLTLLQSDMPYRCLGFINSVGQTVLVNLRPFATSVRYEGEVELEPYEIRVSGGSALEDS